MTLLLESNMTRKLQHTTIKHEHMKWKKLAPELETITSIAIPRQYFPLSSVWPNVVKLHFFVDASTKAYGTVAYLNSAQQNHSSFVMPKLRIAPTKELTLPQLELTAAVIGVRLPSYLQGVSFMWAKCVSGPTARLSYIGFVAPRNLNHLSLSVWGKSKNLPRWRNWKYCPTSDNAADL